ncbi:MAG: hypothetical protein J2P46_06240, partial [Zavarzinella sp.]|nr:hypothetical protein [Zavarzinella sp.]
YEQVVRLNRWLSDVSGKRVAIVECGAGTAIPTVRRLSERVARTHQGTLVRINVRDPAVPVGQIGLACGALDGLRRIDELVTTGAGT